MHLRIVSIAFHLKSSKKAIRSETSWDTLLLMQEGKNKEPSASEAIESLFPFCHETKTGKKVSEK